MNFCFISGFSQSADSLRRLGESLNITGEKFYLSPSELVGEISYLEKLYSKMSKLDNLVLVGWSLGASIALEYAASFPDQVSSLVIISGTASYLASNDNPAGIEPARVEALIKGVTLTKEQSLRRFISTLCSPNLDDRFEQCYAQALSVPSSILVDSLEYFKGDFRDKCSKIKCPTLIVHDLDDRVVPIAQSDLLSDLISGSRKFVTSGQGHLIHLRQPEVIAREIEKLFRAKFPTVESSFSKAANTYDQNAEVQRQIADKLLKLIPPGLKAHNILDLGTGTGYLALKAKQQFPNAELTISDISSEMIEVAKTKLGNIRSLCCDFKDITGIDNVDLIISSAALHWSASFEQVLETLNRILAAKGLLAISVMLEGTLSELRSLRQLVAPGKKQVPILRELEYYNKQLINKNFQIIESETFDTKVYFSTFDQLIDSLKKTGVTGGSSERLTRDEFKRLRELYLQNYSSEKGLQLSFKAGFIVADKR